MKDNQSSVRIYRAIDGQRLEINYGGRNPQYLPINTELLLLIQKEIATELYLIYQAEEEV